MLPARPRTVGTIRMSPVLLFFLASTITFLVYEFAALGQFTEAQGTRQFALLGLTIRLAPPSNDNARRIRKFLFVILLILLMVTAHVLFSGASALLGQQKRLALICGLLFGPLFAIWIN